MTALAIDALGQFRREHCGVIVVPGAGCAVDGERCRISVVAEHAPVKNLTAETRMIGPVVTGAHSPVASHFGIPADGEFD